MGKVNKKDVPTIRNARAELSTPKVAMLGFQHMFAFMGATIVVPLLTGLSVSTALLTAGLGTLLCHLVTGGKVPVFLGSSFAYLGGFAIVTAGGTAPENLPYACAAVAFSGLIYVLLSWLIKVFTIERVMKLFPPVVTAPMVIAIGLILLPSAVDNCETNWILAGVAFAAVIAFNMWGKGMVKIMPILLAVVVAYVVALLTNAVDLTSVKEAAWIGLPLHTEHMGLLAIDFSPEFFSALVAIVPIALATTMEHIGDISAISATTGENYIKNPGLHRTLLGDGLATMLAGLLGGPANTTYGENTGVLAMTRVFDPFVIRLSAVFAIVLSFSPKFDALICSVPAAVIGGISIMLYGMISIIGVRNLIDNKVDYTDPRNLIISVVVLFGALAVNDIGGITIPAGSMTISISGIAFAAIAGIVLNLVLPGNKYRFGVNPEGDASQGIHLK